MYHFLQVLFLLFWKNELFQNYYLLPLRRPTLLKTQRQVGCEARGYAKTQEVALLLESGCLLQAPADVSLSICQNFVKISSNFSKTFINFCLQYSIFQHFSAFFKIYIFLQNSAKNSAKFCKNLTDL